MQGFVYVNIVFWFQLFYLDYEIAVRTLGSLEKWRSKILPLLLLSHDKYSVNESIH